MDRRAQVNVGVLVTLFIGIIVCIVLAQQIFNEQTTMTTKNAAANETVSISSLRNGSGFLNTTIAVNLVNKPTPTDWQYIGGCPLTGFVLRNESGDTMIVTTDYVIDATYFNFTLGTATEANYGTDGASNLTYVDYTYCQDGYIQNSGARTITTLIGLFTIIALLVWVITTGRLDEWFS